MDQNLLLVFFFFIALGNLASAQFYDLTRAISYAGQTITITHPTSARSTRYLITAPSETFIQASCSISTTCSKHVFSISRAGEVDLSDGSTYCGVGNLQLFSSIGNEIVVALNNGNNAPGAFTCRFTSVALSNTNCDCGWSANTKIVGGVNTGVNEIVSHAGLVDSSTNQVYCGAVISKKEDF